MVLRIQSLRRSGAFDFDLFPDYETLTEASGDKFIKSMATGIRNWGDVYYGGPYKGKNSYMNLEYDVPHNFILQFARTGQRKYLDAARRMAQHQADIDTNHKTGWQWKHSPRHTEIQAEFGHTFTRGLLENYYLTGNRSTFEAGITLGDYFTKQIRNPRETGNERQIGWGMISLLPVYEATWDAKYLEAVRQAVDRLAAEQEPGGKFKIRWDNRIAFFNGIGATGFIYYERATGDERAAQAALRTIRRTKGFYPEYAGRTLEALAWAYQRTSDPEYLDLLKLTYETTMEKAISWNAMELGAPTIFTAHTLPFLEKSGLATKPMEPLNLTAEQFASENGMHVHHVPAGEGNVYFKIDSTEPFRLALIRKGAWKSEASATLSDPAGRVIQEWDFPRESKIWQREIFSAQLKLQGTYRLALRSPSVENVKSGSYVTWDIATSRAIPVVLQTPGFSGLQFVTPFLFTTPRGDTDRIELELAGEGEGFKKAVVFDPDGNVAGTMEAFVDLGDTNRHAYKLSAAIPPQHRGGIWRLSLQDVSLTKLTGLSPYFSTSARSFFQPDRN
jgi:rhamnogalacturonyl hydrolase YesR